MEDPVLDLEQDQVLRCWLSIRTDSGYFPFVDVKSERKNGHKDKQSLKIVQRYGNACIPRVQIFASPESVEEMEVIFNVDAAKSSVEQKEVKDNKISRNDMKVGVLL